MNKNNNTESDQIRVSDISNKEVTERLAVSEGYISLSSETLSIIKQNSNKKGNVIATAKVAGIMAAKQTSSIIPQTKEARNLEFYKEIAFKTFLRFY